MIDWITAQVPCFHAKPINDGIVMRTNRDGSTDWETHTRLKVCGSFESGVMVRTGREGWIEVSGNLAKFFQGHNLWGTSDLPGLLFEFLQFLALNRPDLVQPTPEDVAAWREGRIGLTRVDCTETFELPTKSDCLSWLRAAEQTAYMKHRGRGQLIDGTTLMFGRGSRRWALKIYAKGPEIEANADHQPALADLPYARAWADNKLRAEVTLRGLELRRLGLGDVTGWLPLDGVPFDASALLRERLGAMTMTANNTLPAAVLETLTTTQRVAYAAWESGSDLQQMLPKASFYRLRAKLLPHGVDVATVVATEDRSNVVPLVRVLEAVPAQVPDWAIGTPLYFEPRRIAA